jgi:hypothetical protein
MKKVVLFVVLSLLFSSPLVLAQNAEISPSFSVQPNNINATEALWDVLANYNADSLTGVLQSYGVVFTGTNFIVSAFNVGTMWKLDLNGNLLGSFTITGSTVPSGQGFRDMEYANGFLWGGANSNIIYKIDLATNTQVGTLTLPTGTLCRGLAYDPVRNGFWSSTFGGNITCYDATTGLAIPGAVLVNADAGKHGLAYDNRSPGGPYLWVSIENSTQTNIKISRYNLSTLAFDQSWIVECPLTTGGTSTLAGGGLDLRDNLVPGKLTLITQVQGTPDRIIVFEVAVLDAGVLAPFNLTAPAAGVTVTSIPASSTPVTITWDTSRAAANYKWIFGAPTVPPRILTVPRGTNSYTLTLGQLDNILAGLGLAQGDSVVGQWDVWAFRNNLPANDSLKATNGPRAITLKRQKPALTPFSLVSPLNNTRVVTSVFNSSPINITWTKSGAGATYKWKYGTGLESKKTTGAILTVPSNNGGFDTVLTVVNSALDAVLAGLGVAPGDSSVGQWTVYAYSGSDSLKASQTFNITFKRQAKGDVLVAYDSSSVACIASKDSVSLYLNNKGMTFDLFNRGTQTGTNVLSFRGYKSIIWLGEGTSVMSVAQKDSMKAYLNNPPAGQKSKLIIFAEDIGYQFGRTGSTYIDLDFMNTYLGANFVLDRPTAGGNQGFYGSYINPGLTDSTVGTWPDVLSRFDPPSTHDLYKFRADGSTNGIGKVAPKFNVCTFGVDIESMIWAVDGPGLPPYKTRLDGAFLYLNTDGTLIPVELTSFTSSVSGNNVVLNWSTATEVNNSGFQVERKSINGNYISVGFVQGKGTTTEEQNYMFADKDLAVGTYTYRLKQMDFDGTFEYSPEVEAEVGVPMEFELSQNYPNPFNPSTSIKFSLVTDSRVTLRLFDVIGQEVATLINNDLAAGYHSTIVDGSNLSSGVYFYRLDATGVNGQKYSSVKKMILTK